MSTDDCQILLEVHNVSLWDVINGRRYRRLLLRLIFGCSISLFLIALCGLAVFDYQHNHLLLDYIKTKEDMVIISSTYYEKSKSFPNNTVAVLFNAHQLFYLKHPVLTFTSSNSTHTGISNFRVQQVVAQVPFYCKWVPFLAIGHVQPDMTSLRMTVGQTATEIYSHYGAFLQFYVRSMLSDLHRLLEKYPNVRVDPWPALRLGDERASHDSFDANLELEFRNQAAAMTDCLLMYKENAEYIIFPDPDEFIIPRLGKDYLVEFQKVFGANPMAAAVAYNMTQTTVESGSTFSLFSIRDTLQSVRFKGEVRWGKLVVRPELLDSVWIHRSYAIKKPYKQISLPVESNSMLHLRFWNLTSTPTRDGVAATYDPLLSGPPNEPLIPETDLEKIEEGFNKRREEFSTTYYNLAKKEIYYPLLEKCYNEIFYNGKRHATCKGPELCKIPRFPGIRCMNAEAKFESFAADHGLYVHKLISSKLEESNNGCRV